MMYCHELYTFIVVVEQGSFLKASKELFITPASVMNQINKLEDQMGIKLFDRTNQGVNLTKAGCSIYKDVKKIVKISDNAIAHAKEIALKEQQTIRIGTSILRPCKMLIDMWSKIDDGTLPISMQIIPFDDTPAGMELMLSSIGEKIDCFVGPCDSVIWHEKYNILELGREDCKIAIPRKHHLSQKVMLCWEDLNGEKLMLVKRGDSPVLDALRDEIDANHPQITVLDAPHFYDTSIFNECEQLGCLMETLDIWQDVHPSLVTLPIAWNYQVPYGIVYAKNPSETVMSFIGKIKNQL